MASISGKFRTHCFKMSTISLFQRENYTKLMLYAACVDIIHESAFTVFLLYFIESCSTVLVQQKLQLTNHFQLAMYIVFPTRCGFIDQQISKRI